jgi:hypothetical protein
LQNLIQIKEDSITQTESCTPGNISR